MNKQIKILVTICIFVHYGFNFAQSKKELEKEKNVFIKKIEYANKLLNKNISKQENTVVNLKLMHNKIVTRQQLIESIKNDIEQLNSRIDNYALVIGSLNNDLKKLKEEYEKLILFAYRNKQTLNVWMFLFSSENFNQAYRRYKYIVEYTKYRKEQKELIVAISQVLKQKNNELNKRKREKEDLLMKNTNEKRKLDREITDKERLISTLKKDEKRLKEEIKENEENANRVAREIEKIIREEKNKEKDKIVSTENKILSNDFLRNKGKLGWPVAEGIIVSNYGKHEHQVLKGVVVQNSGVDISTSNNSKVFCVYDGEVSGVYKILGANNVVIVKHGSFFSVYQNVINLQVKVGVKIKKGDIIGEVYTESRTNSSILHLEIWNGQNTVDPALWMTQK